MPDPVETPKHLYRKAARGRDERRTHGRSPYVLMVGTASGA
ncbi:MAG TPA: hypothetical protein VF877_08305 [Gaiellaceae bacterium]